MKKVFAICLFITLLFGCGEINEEQIDAGTINSSEIVNNSADNMANDVVSLVESDGSQALLSFVELLEVSDVFNVGTNEKEWTKEKLSLFVQYFLTGPVSKVNADDLTSFDEIKGLYEWNPEIGDFDKQESEFFIVKFPTKNSQTNNAKFKITDLNFVEIIEEGESYELPSLIVSNLEVDNVILMELDFMVDWSSIGLPEKATIDLSLVPFTFQLSYDDTFEQKASLLSVISLENEVIVGIDLSVEFETSYKETPVYFKGFVNYRGLIIDGNIDVRNIGDDADPNDFIDLVLYSGDEKVGDIVFILEEFEPGLKDYIPYVEYPDGTLVKIEVLLDDVSKEVESFLEDFDV